MTADGMEKSSMIMTEVSVVCVYARMTMEKFTELDLMMEMITY